MDKRSLESLHFELRNLLKEISVYRDSGDYIYTITYKNWLERLNYVLKKYDAIKKWNVEPVRLREFDLPSTKKTVKEVAVNNLQSYVDDLAKQVQFELDGLESADEEKGIPSHQMRRCFITGHTGCPLNPSLHKNKVFVAMPFDDKYQDSYAYGIVEAVEAMGLDHYRADGEIRNKDIMCKICGEIQSSRLIIANISGLNPNVMLEQGLAYGLGKPVIIVKDKETKAISDLGSIEYIEYAHAQDLASKLYKALTDL